MNEAATDRNLVELLQKDSERAFESIYALYSPRLFKQLFKLVKSKAPAQAILQEVFVILWAHRHSLDPEKSLGSFLFRMAGNKVYDFFRKAATDHGIQSDLVSISTPNYENMNDTFVS